MAYSVHTLAGAQPISERSTVKRHTLGTMIRASDPTFGEGEFIYLEGATNTVIGSVVTYNPLDTIDTVLAPNTANLASPLAVAMAAITTGEFGWYQISGAAVLKKTGVVFAPNVRVFLSATIGRVRATLASGKNILGARTINAATVTGLVSTITVLINRPHAQGQAI